MNSDKTNTTYEYATALQKAFDINYSTARAVLQNTGFKDFPKFASYKPKLAEISKAMKAALLVKNLASNWPQWVQAVEDQTAAEQQLQRAIELREYLERRALMTPEQRNAEDAENAACAAEVERQEFSLPNRLHSV